MQTTITAVFGFHDQLGTAEVPALNLCFHCGKPVVLPSMDGRHPNWQWDWKHYGRGGTDQRNPGFCRHYSDTQTARPAYSSSLASARATARHRRPGPVRDQDEQWIESIRSDGDRFILLAHEPGTNCRDGYETEHWRVYLIEGATATVLFRGPEAEARQAFAPQAASTA